MPMERSQHKVAAGVGTGAWPGDTLREQEAPKPVLWKEEQKVKRREPDGAHLIPPGARGASASVMGLNLTILINI